MEGESGILLRAAAPKHWVIHGYEPDYGIDGTVEIFDYVDDERLLAEVTPTSQRLTLLRFYGLRPKLMGLFNKIHYQRVELEYRVGELELARWWGMAAHCAQILLRLDVWDYEGWEILRMYRSELETMAAVLATAVPSEETRAACLELWRRLDVVGRTFEETAREWGLPTPLGLLSS